MAFEFHENPQVLHVNTLPDRNDYMPFAPGQDPFAQREDSSSMLSLNGDWEFRYFDSFLDIPEDFLTAAMTDSIRVPGNMELSGFGSPMYTNIRYPFMYDPPHVPRENPTGIYRKQFELEKKDKRYYLITEGVDSCFYLYVNGQFAGYSQVSHMTSEFDLTDLLVNARNTICLVVLKWCDGSYLEDQDKWRMSGIIRDLYLLQRPQKHIRAYTICTDLSQDHSNAQIRVQIESDTDVSAELYSPDEELLYSTSLSGGEEKKIPVKNPILWNAENPALYRLIFKSSEEWIGEKIGIRTVEVCDGVFCVNHQPVKLKGVNRHESDPKTGSYVSREAMEGDLILMKQHNINAIRTSHYPNSPIFYRLCDEYGFYVIDEADIESHGSVEASLTTDNNWDYSGISLLVNEPCYAQALTDRVLKMIRRDRNRPCVLFWSLGNESGYSIYMEQTARLAKKEDPTRLLHYQSIYHLEGSKPADSSGEVFPVLSDMYNSPAWIRNYLQDPSEDRPFVLCEYCHAMGNGPGDPEDYWTLFYESDRLMGGFVWEWCDHGIERGKAEDGRIRYAYGGDYHEAIHDGNFCLDGLVYPDRRVHTGLLELKNVYRPVRVSRGNRPASFRFRNTMAFTSAEGLLKCRYEITEYGIPVSEGILSFILPAGGYTDIIIPELQKEAEIGDAIRFSFLLKEDRLYAKKGYEVGFDQILLSFPEDDNRKMERKKKAIAAWKQQLSERLEAEDPTRPEIKENSLSRPLLVCEESPRYFYIKGGQFCYRFHRILGQFDRMIVNGIQVLDHAVEFNSYRAPTDNDANIKSEWKRFGYDRLLTTVYSAEWKQEKDEILIFVSSGQGTYSHHPNFRIETIFRIDPKGSIHIDVQVKTEEKRPWLPRFGLRFLLNSDFSKLSYYGYGPYESYQDKHQASYKGLFESSVYEQLEDYIRPQENGSHYGTEYMALSSDKLIFTAESDSPFSFSALDYTQEELEKKQHNYELEKAGYTVLCLDYKQSGVGSASCGPILDSKYRLSEKSFHFSVILSFIGSLL